MFKKFFSILVVIIFFSAVNLFSQVTYPTPYDLSTGDYSLTEWASTNPAGIYPPNMIFHRTGVQDPQIQHEVTSNYTGAYNLNSGTRISGKGADGFSFVNAATSGNLGAAVLALNTIARNTIRVSWKGAVVASGARLYGIRLQYRIGDATFKDVLDANGNPIEILSSTPVGQVVEFNNILLPEEAENQPIVYLRWKYYYIPSASGTRPEMRVDDILVTSYSSIGTPTKLIVKEIIPAVPSSYFPFSVKLQTVDDNNIPKFVNNNTTVTLTTIPNLIAPETQKTMPAGTLRVQFDNLRYLDTNSISLTFSAPGLTSAIANISFIEGPAGFVVENIGNKTHKGFPLSTFTVRTVKANGETFTNFNGQNATITATGPGSIAGTTSKTFFNGIATFDDISFNTAGNYSIEISVPGFMSSYTAQITVADEITIAEIIIPDYIKGVGTLGTDPYGPRLPAFALIQLNNLLPNTTYRYITGGTDDPNYDITQPANNGAGNNIHLDANSGTYIYNSSRSFSTQESYSTFTTGPNETSRKIWINLVPTGNAVFNNQKNVYWLVGIAFDDGRFIKRFRTTKTSQSRDFGADTSLVTGIYDPTSWLTPKTFVVLYDSNNMPVSIAIVQSIGAKLQTPGFPPQSPWWYADFEETPSAWATYIPNNLAGGIRKLVQYDWQGNAIRTWTDDDGIWATVDTRLANGGRLNPILFGTPQLKLFTPYDNEEICNHQAYTFVWKANGISKLSVQVSTNGGYTYETLFNDVDAKKGYFEWKIPRNTYSEKPLTFRLISNEHTYINDISNNNYIWDTPLQAGGSPSTALCLNENYTLFVDVSGSDLKYQWYKDGKKISGATNSTLQLNNVQYQTSGTYTCHVIGKAVCPDITTKPIEIYVVTPATITTQPKPQVTVRGGEVTLYAEAHIIGPDGTRPARDISIQWYRGTTPLVDDGKHIAGARSNMLRLSNVQPNMESNEYYVTFTGKCPNTAVSSQKVSVKIVDMIFSKQPVDAVKCSGELVKFTATATSSISGNISYQWYYENTPLTNNSRISGVNTNELTISDINPNDAGKYRVMATLDSYGIKVWSNFAKLDVNTIPKITSQPDDNIIVKDGDDLEIEVKATSLTPIEYQWYKDGRAIAGATSSIYRKSNTNSSDMGEYYCLLKNECGEVNSKIAYVTVTRSIISTVDNVINRNLGVLPVTPNPVNGTAKVKFIANTGENVKLSITDALGNELAKLFDGLTTGNVQTIEYNTSSLATGVYYVTLKSTRGISTEKLIVVR